ncbi:carboxypeptidase-like regulatory domain-containing protein [Flavobacterium sp. XS1P32]|uniref:carboxypeptidase-like regulatory domain-containing protein n=1 Tax=Flavobacterium sp. XS1P32 TaxID=3401726 RepID=UPI003AAA4A4D
MKKFVLLLLFVSSCMYSQIKGIVLDESNKPIPYVNIWVENENIGTTSEENGSFSIHVEDQNKVLIFSALGFETKKVKFSEAEKVVLKEIAFQLDEVIISKSKSTVEIEIGDSKNINHIYFLGGVPWIYAKRFNYSNDFSKTPFIKNTIIFTTSEIKNATFKLRIFEVNKEGAPGLDLLDEDIIVAVKKGNQENKIDLTKYNLLVPQNGIFIAFEWMIIESNKIKLNYKEKNSNKNREYITFAPSIVCNPVELENTFEYRGGKWTQSKINIREGKYKHKVTEPAINLTLTN